MSPSTNKPFQYNFQLLVSVIDSFLYHFLVLFSLELPSLDRPDATRPSPAEEASVTGQLVIIWRSKLKLRRDGLIRRNIPKPLRAFLLALRAGGGARRARCPTAPVIDDDRPQSCSFIARLGLDLSIKKRNEPKRKENGIKNNYGRVANQEHMPPRTPSWPRVPARQK